MKKRSLRRATAVASMACLTSLLLTSCDKPAPGLAKVNATNNSTVYSDATAARPTTVGPAWAPSTSVTGTN